MDTYLVKDVKHRPFLSSGRSPLLFAPTYSWVPKIHAKFTLFKPISNLRVIRC
jgi:hypothetical protein